MSADDWHSDPAKGCGLALIVSSMLWVIIAVCLYLLLWH